MAKFHRHVKIVSQLQNLLPKTRKNSYRKLTLNFLQMRNSLPFSTRKGFRIRRNVLIKFDQRNILSGSLAEDRNLFWMRLLTQKWSKTTAEYYTEARILAVKKKSAIMDWLGERYSGGAL
ncbi:hypothetical protein RvY_11429 [Ramazzottius varieornatus]|uniref:Uncharacterized protein n=1 Tax=Ramazzottius varieornatus TaxID=947166 RepID=A0A1D1VKF0_RAMVA|nr:hypothetical protein RvY_11429 [Ramazzottius varieornatus]